ncbi:MAG: YidC/Oxa1 family membrane protein insertase [Candidatus Promineifilaceae bacterium]|nr:YidC/Oxa1 family membrane protein insertase [Candidatus Promineifilaceae bacterium]
MFDAVIIDPMTNALLLFYDFLGNNFVLAIAVFTVVIRLLTLPLNLRQQKSSLEMQEIQPQVQAIQKKYKDNPQKMQEEFKKIGYNPAQTLTGCLPLLLQFPILIGLYRAIIVLLGSTPQALFEVTDRLYPWTTEIVNLADALPIPNKFLWMNLAQPDPWFVLPFLVFATMFVQQRYMTPQRKKDEEDKKGKKKEEENENPMVGMTQSMQWTMPIMFGFFSLTFPAGLSVYFVMSSVIGIGQGYITRRDMEKEQAKKERKAEIGPTTGIPSEEEQAEAAQSSKNGQETKQQKKKQGKRKKRSAKRR